MEKKLSQTCVLVKLSPFLIAEEYYPLLSFDNFSFRCVIEHFPN